MKKSMTVAAALLVGAGAAGVGAFDQVPNPWYGGDTPQVLIKEAISNAVNLSASEAPDFVAGGSGTGQSAMIVNSNAAATQQATPMSKMMTSCAFNGGGSNGSGMTNATGLVMGLDAVDILASESVVGTCSSTPSNSQDVTTGLASSGTSAFTTNVAQNWKWVLALVYGGLDYSTGLQDCGQASRINLVNNWSNLFANSCSNGAPNNICGDATHVAAGDGTHTPLWHAFRRDDGTGTSDIFSTLLGINVAFPATSNSSNNGFGASPYCNSLNWDTNVSNFPGTSPSITACALGKHDQFVGPGGVLDPQSACVFSNAISAVPATCTSPPCAATNVTGKSQFGLTATAETCGAAGTGNHRMPPAGTWGVAPVGSQPGEPSTNAKSAWDVLPTGQQDNDPIRRPCLGTTTGNPNRPAEEVCNTDGKLGLVVSMPPSDFIPDTSSGATSYATPVQYPTAGASSFGVGALPLPIFSCAPAVQGTTPRVHNGECPDGDTTYGAGLCQAPTNGTTTQVETGFGQLPISITGRSGTLAPPNSSLPLDGRVYNWYLYDGTNTDGAVSYMQQTLFTTTLINNGATTSSVTTAKVGFAGGAYRIHQVATIFQQGSKPAGIIGCQMQSIGDQMGCLVQADPCSIAYEGDDGKTWNGRTTDPNGAGTSPAGTVTDAFRVGGMYPNTATVQAFGSTSGGQLEYPLARKIYYNTAIGFGNFTTTGADVGAAGELDLAAYLSGTASAVIAGGVPMNTALVQSGFFQIGSAGPGGNTQFCEDFNEALVCGAATNNDGCASATIPSTIVSKTNGGETVCGNGIVEPFEECDPGVASQASICSTTCRCKGVDIFTGNATSPCASH